MPWHADTIASLSAGHHSDVGRRAGYEAATATPASAAATVATSPAAAATAGPRSPWCAALRTFLSSLSSASRCACHKTLCCSVVMAVAAPPIRVKCDSEARTFAYAGPAAAGAQYLARPVALPPPSAAVAGTPAQQPGWRTLPSAAPTAQQVPLQCSETRPAFRRALVTAPNHGSA